MAKEIPETKARQGRRGYPVLVVLLASLALAFAVWFVVEIYGTAIQTPQTQTGQIGS
jgi:hypothetical protein